MQAYIVVAVVDWEVDCQVVFMGYRLMLAERSFAVGLAPRPQVQQCPAVDGQRPPQHQGAAHPAPPASIRLLAGSTPDTESL